MYWIVQSNMYNEEGFATLMASLGRQGCKHSTHKIVPFDHRLDPTPEVGPDERVMVLGTYTLTQIARDKGWAPGSFLNHNFSFVTQLRHWGTKMFNHDAIVCRLADANVRALPMRMVPEFFVRPTTDSKDFTGSVMTHEGFAEWQEKILSLTPEDGSTVTKNTEVMFAETKEIFQEFRLWIVDRRVVTASRYKLGKKVSYDAMVDADVMVFGQKMAEVWSPARAFVMDVFDGAKGYQIGEVNNLNSAGFYKADMNKLVGAIEGMAPLICDGCNVRDPWEHRCHGGSVRQYGEPVPFQCECPSCRREEACLARRSQG